MGQTLSTWLLLAPIVFLFPGGAGAGNALQQSLEQPSSRGTVAEKQPPEPTPAPSPRVMTDAEADKKIHVEGRPKASTRRKPTPVPSPDFR